MALETKQTAMCIKKVLRTSIRKGYRCVFEHPILFSLGVLLFLLYRSSPGFFAFLLSSSPVIVCTTILLGILLSYGDTNLPEVDGDNKITPVISALEFRNSSSDIYTEENRSFSVPGSEIRNSATDFKERETKQTVSFRERAGEHVDLDDDVPLLRRVDEEYEILHRRNIPRALTPFSSLTNFHQDAGIGQDYNFNQDRELEGVYSLKDKADRSNNLFETALSVVDKKDTSFGMFSSTQNVSKHVEMEERLNQERVLIDLAVSVRNISEEKPMEGVAGSSRPASAVSVCQIKNLDDIKIDNSKAIEDNLLDSSLGSPWARVGSQDGSSGFDSDRAESSSPDASMTDIAPVLDEIDPLLGSDSTRPDPIPMDGLDTDSHVSSHDHQTDDESNDETEKIDAKDYVEEKKKDDKEAAFIWTADDEKNVMDLGYSEMERNRRLEILMARRRSRKNIKFDIHDNLINIDSSDAGRSIDDLSHFRIQVPHISVPRRNPFDLPYDPEEAAIPGSAPSILHTRKNPFDLPVEKSSDSAISSHDNLSPEESVKPSHHDIFFRRHDSFNFGGMDATQERRYSRFKPYFVSESVEGSTSNFQRQLSDKSESKLSSVSESDMTSSVADQEDHKGLDEKGLHGEHGSSALPRQGSDLADTGSECSDGINSVDVELDHSDIDDRELPLQHFVFERSREREAYLASTIGKGHEEDYMVDSMKPPHLVADLLSWEDGDGENSIGAISSLEPTTTVEFSNWVSSPRPAEEQSRSGDLQEYLDTRVTLNSDIIALGASNLAEQAGNAGSIYSNNEIPLDNMIHGSMQLPSEFDTVTLPVISRDLHPIPEERVVENFNMQENQESVIFTDTTTALTGLRVVEEHFGVGSEGSQSSAVASHSVQSPLTEPTEISNPFSSMAAEHDRVNVAEMKEGRAVGYLFDSDDEADKIYPEPTEDTGIDDNFLSELDAVGDFRVEPMGLDQQVPGLGTITDNPHANGVAGNSLISLQTSGNISLAMSDASVLDSGEQSPLADDLNGADAEFGWSLRTSDDDPEQTVYNPRRRILETSPFEATNVELKRSCDDMEVTSVTTSSASNLAVGSSEQQVDFGTTETDSHTVILEARSLEDIETALKQASDDVIDNSSLDNETSMVSSVDTNSELLECAGRLHVVDTKTVDDDSFKEQAGSVAVASSSLEFIEHNRHQQGSHVESPHVVGDDRESEDFEPTTSNMTSIEAKTLDDIDAVFKKLFDANAKSTVHAMESESACERCEQSEQQ